MEQVTVRKLDHTGRQVLSYLGQVLHREGDAIVLHTTWDRLPLDLGYVVFETGSRWTEHFYAGQWYNIFEICASDGCLQGWYCNVTRPTRITAGEVVAEDLALDLWVAANGEMQVLDEDEFAALPLSLKERQAAQGALSKLKAMAARKTPPFDKRRDDA
jgi:predicted RNA-binding protein associated with RNAse of E/G family